MSTLKIFVAGPGAPRSLRALWPHVVREHPGPDFSDVLILTPHRAQIRNNRRVLLEETPMPAFVPPRQAPLYDWLQGLLPDSLRVLTGEERFLLLVDLLMLPEMEQLRDALGVKERRVGLGLARHLFQALDDLRLWAFDRTADELRATVDQTVDEYPQVADRIRALLQLLTAYQDRLKRAQAVDLPEALRILLQDFPAERALAGLRFLVFQGLALLDPLTREVLRRALEAARQRGIAVWALVPVTRAWPEPPFLQLLRSQPGAEENRLPPERTPHLEGRAYLTRGDEVRAVAREIKRLLLRSEEPLRIGITAPSLFDLLPALRQAFHEYGLDFVTYTGDPLAQTPWARLWQLGIQVVRAGAPTQDLRALVRSPYFRAPKRDLLHRALQKVSIVQLDPLLPYLSNLEDEERAALETLLQTLRRDLGVFIGEEAQPLEAFIEATRTFFRNWTVPMPPEVESAFARAFQVLGQVAGVLVAPKVPPEEFLNLWHTLLQSTRLPDPERPEPEFPIHVLGMAEAQAFEGDLLFVLDATEETLPGPGPNDFFLPHRFREALALPIRERVAQEQEFRFHLLLEAPYHRVVVAYPRVDEAGNPRLPTLLADEVLTAQTPLTPSAEVYQSGALAPEETEIRRALASPQVLTQQPMHPTVSQVQAWLEQREYQVPLTLLESLVVSNTCGYRAYLEKILHLGGAEEFTLLPVAEEGNLVHRFLYQLFATLKERYLPQGALPPEEEFLRVFAREMDRWLGDVAPWALLRAFLKERYQPVGSFLYEHLKAQDQEGLRPRYLEHRLKAPLPGTNLVVFGRMDRVDTSADGSRFRVIDYKTGKPQGKKEDRFWQVWAYTALYRRHQAPESIPEPPQLIFLGDQLKVETADLKVETVDSLIAGATEALREAAERLFQAEFAPNPKACYNCPFKEACPYAG